MNFDPTTHPQITVTDDGCWLYDGNPTGKGHMKLAAGRVAMVAHAAFYAVLVGTIQRGQVLHHCCEVKACVNPDHLEPLWPIQHRAEHNLTPDECPHGHDYAEHGYRDGGRRLRCRVCTTERKAVAKRRAMARRQWRCRFCGTTGGEETFALVGRTTRACPCGRAGKALERIDQETAA